MLPAKRTINSGKLQQLTNNSIVIAMGLILILPYFLGHTLLCIGISGLLGTFLSLIVSKPLQDEEYEKNKRILDDE
jgi:hypothetical protein